MKKSFLSLRFFVRAGHLQTKYLQKNNQPKHQKAISNFLKNTILYFVLFTAFFACNEKKDKINEETVPVNITDTLAQKSDEVNLTDTLIQNKVDSLNSIDSLNPVDTLSEVSFRFPCGDEQGHGYYIAQGYQDTINGYGDHLGLDINGVGGGNSDLGDTIYSVSNGIVAIADPENYLTVYHRYQGKIIKALYFHCDTILVKSHQYVKKGEPVATIGNVCTELAHLYFELIKDTNQIAGFYGDPIGLFFDPMTILPFYDK